MKFKIISPDYKTKTKPVEIWTEIEAADECEAAIIFAEIIMTGPADGEEVKIWVQSDRLYKYNVRAEIKFNIEEILE